MMGADDNDTMLISPDPDKLYVYHRQQLSAMLDGELSPDEARFMLRRLEHDIELAACWERWQVGGDVLRGRADDLLPSDFAHRVALAIHAGGASAVSAQPAVAGTRPRFARWGGAAIAASVALLAIFVVRQPQDALQPGTGDAPSSMVASRAGTAPADPIENPASASAAAPDAMALAVETPSPASPLVDTAAALATAVAVAEVPRRASERRSRGQSQRAAARVQARRADSEPVFAVGPSSPALLASGHDAIVPARDLMAPATAAPARPWPRALLPGASSNAFAVGYGNMAGSGFQPASGSTSSFEPFHPQVAAMSPSLQGVPAPARSNVVPFNGEVRNDTREHAPAGNPRVEPVRP